MATQAVRVLGIDTSRHQGKMNYEKAYQAGARFVIHRATVGDYYTDDKFDENYKRAVDAGFMVQGAYMVIAPADSAGRKISSGPHLNRFFDAVGDKKINSYVIDSELSRGQTKTYITALTSAIVNAMISMDKKPAAYTRQSWWDYNILSLPLWGKLDLFAARYISPTLSGPWGDGRYRFRDWQTWKFWQFSADGNGRGAEFGAESKDIDLDYYNGDIESLFGWAGVVEKPWQVAVTEFLRTLGYDGPAVK